MNDHFQFPDAARRAFEDYPRIEASDAFNRAIFERLDAQKSRRRATFLGRIEEFLGLDLWQFAASGMLGALLPALVLGALYFSNRTSTPPPPFPADPPAPLRAMGPFYAREWELRARFSTPDQPQSPPDRAKTPSKDEISCVEFSSHLA